MNEADRKILLGNDSFRRGDASSQALFSRAIRFVQPTGPHMEVSDITEEARTTLYASYVRAGSNLAIVYSAWPARQRNHQALPQCAVCGGRSRQS